ncbi:unnamed protein product [Rhodiola kirilowii]
MEFLKELDRDAFAYLEKLDKTTWCRHAFKYYALSDSLCSNISECFNAFIKNARDQPIISCLETIRKLLMRRFNEKFERMQKYEGLICPRIWKKLENNKVQGMGCHLTWGGGITFQIESSKWGSYVCTPMKHTCGCQVWDLTGIPCVHACSTINYLREDINKFVHDTYKREMFLKTYQFMIEAIPGPIEWPTVEGDPILPPLFRRQGGRPKKLRIRAVNEPINPHRKRKTGVVMHCGKCGLPGHYVRKCQGQVGDLKKATAAAKDARRASKKRLKKKEIVSADVGIQTVLHTMDRNADGKVFKAKTKRKARESAPIVIRESQVSTQQE